MSADRASDAKEEAQLTLRNALDLEKRIRRLEIIFGLEKLERIMPLDSVVLPEPERERIDDSKQRDRKRRGYDFPATDYSGE